ncbi:hypothetical protein [Nocardioides solisilvae]|uniref:hypothetical protein n=1 Tax=Nocardioides solisilvae TaxID=1542435 RepID=UPI0019528245|nr:hypothetical protein [Nocardioides solisilvae]
MSSNSTITTTATTGRRDEGTTRRGHDRTRESRAWALTGVAAGVAGIVGIQASATVDAVYDERNQGDAVAITERLSEQVPNLLVFHTATTLCTVLVLVFALGLRRRLAGQTRAGSLLPDVSAAGLLLVSVAGLIGSGLDTEFIFGLAEPDRMVPESAAFYGHWVGTMNWLWLGAGVTGVALAAAALRQAAAPRWIGWVGAVLGGLTLLLGLSPLQYMAGFTGPVMLLVVALGFAFGDRATGR